MRETPLERRFRLHLSWLEKAQRLHEAAQSRTGDKKPEPKKLSYLERQIAEAQRRLQEARDREQATLERLATQLRTHLEKLSGAATVQLPRSQGAGTQDEPTSPEIEAIRTELSRYNRVLSAENSEALGGFLDLPLDEYRVALGLKVASRPGGPWLVSTPKNMLLSALLAALVGVAGFLLVYNMNQAVVFQMGPLQNDGVIAIQCRNDTDEPIEFWVPLSEASAATSSAPAYGIEVYGKQVGYDTYQMLPIPQEAWTVVGAQLDTPLPLLIQPALDVVIHLNLAQYRQLITDLDSVKIYCRDKRGATYLERSITVTR